MAVRKITFEENKKITYASFALLVLVLMVFAVSEGGILNRKVEIEASGSVNSFGPVKVACWNYFLKSKTIFDGFITPSYFNPDHPLAAKFLDGVNDNMVYLDMNGDGNVLGHDRLEFFLPDFKNNFKEMLTVSSGVSSTALGPKGYNNAGEVVVALMSFMIQKYEKESDGLIANLTQAVGPEAKKKISSRLENLNALLDYLYSSKKLLSQLLNTSVKYPRVVCQQPGVSILPLPDDPAALKAWDEFWAAFLSSGLNNDEVLSKVSKISGISPTSSFGGTGSSSGATSSSDSNPYTSVYAAAATGGSTNTSTTGSGTSGTSSTTGTSSGGTTSTGGTSTSSTGTSSGGGSTSTSTGGTYSGTTTYGGGSTGTGSTMPSGGGGAFPSSGGSMMGP